VLGIGHKSLYISNYPPRRAYGLEVIWTTGQQKKKVQEKAVFSLLELLSINSIPSKYLFYPYFNINYCITENFHQSII
jgi:hypothetical protein